MVAERCAPDHRLHQQGLPATGHLTARKCDSKPVYANGRISFELELEPGEAWHSCLLYAIGDGKTIDHAPDHCIAQRVALARGASSADWRDAALKIETSNEEFYRFYHQSLEDMAALRLPIEGTDHLEFVPAAGVPWFVALFGRDSLIVSLQNAMVYPDFARGALEVLSRYQAKKRDDYRDAEPGKIMHELRRGELAHFKLIPHTPYYGTADATILYLIVLHNAWRCTGDPDLLARYMPAAEKCLTWIDEYGDRDGDGFQEYQTRSTAGAYNQGWKDSGEALVNTDGSIVKTPIALVELQGYVYDAWLRMAQIYDALGKPARARALRKKAKALFDRFNDAFWDEASGYYAFCLDGDKKPVLSVASNPGQCLWSGIVPPDRAAKVVKRLMEPDMWSGWGIRTLSSDHPAYNPNSYQNGAVWPHDNGIIAAGLPPLRLRRGGRAHRQRHQRRRRLFHAAPDARTLFGPAARPDQLSGPVSGGQRAAGLGGGIVFRPPADDRGLSARRPCRQALHRSRSARLAPGTHHQRPSRRWARLRPAILARQRGNAVRGPQRRSGGRRPEELRHGRRAMGVARYQKPRAGTRPTFAQHSSVRELPPLRTTGFFASKYRYANLDVATGRIDHRVVKKS